MNRPWRRPLSLAAVALALSGCAAPPPAPLDRGFVQLETMTAAAAVGGELLYPARAGQWHYQLQDGAEGDLVIHERQPDDRFKSQWSINEGQERVEFLAADESGNLVLTAVIDHDDRALTFFQPPLLVSPARLEPGTPVTAESRMKVVDLNNRRRQKATGTANQTITYVGDERIATPLGEQLTHRIEVEFTASLTMAKVNTQTTRWVTADHGPVVLRRVEEIKVLGILGQESETTLVLVEVQ